MKCILCGAVLRGAGSMLLGKPCACSACVKQYKKLEALAIDVHADDGDAAKAWIARVQARVDAYRVPDKTTGPLAYAEKNWS